MEKSFPNVEFVKYNIGKRFSNIEFMKMMSGKIPPCWIYKNNIREGFLTLNLWKQSQKRFHSIEFVKMTSEKISHIEFVKTTSGEILHIEFVKTTLKKISQCWIHSSILYSSKYYLINSVNPVNLINLINLMTDLQIFVNWIFFIWINLFFAHPIDGLIRFIQIAPLAYSIYFWKSWIGMKRVGIPMDESVRFSKILYSKLTFCIFIISIFIWLSNLFICHICVIW